MHLFPVQPQIIMNQDIAESRHSFQIAKQLSGDDSMLIQYPEDVGVAFRLRVAPVRNDMVADIEQTFNGQMEIAFGRTMYEGVFDKAFQVVPLCRLENIEVLAQPFKPCGQNILVNQGHPPS